MTMYQGTAPTNIDVWDKPSGTKVGIIRAGMTFTGDAPTTEWVRLNFKVSGLYTYTKKIFLGAWYKEVVTPPPPPPPVTSTLPDVLYIATKADMSDKTEYHKV